jgi:hypothetical protein
MNYQNSAFVGLWYKQCTGYVLENLTTTGSNQKVLLTSQGACRRQHDAIKDLQVTQVCKLMHAGLPKVFVPIFGGGQHKFFLNLTVLEFGFYQYISFSLFFTDIRGPVPPVLNERMLAVTAKVDDTVVVPCVAYANPRPHYR